MASTSRPDEAELFRRIEALADSFQAEAVEEYVRSFSRVLARELGLWRAAELEARYRRVREPRPFQGDPARVRTVFVLSRVTLGADIAITSLALDAAKRRFPASRIVLVGARKNHELFEADPQIHWMPIDYGRRTTLRHRLGASLSLALRLDEPDSIVIDPDSRLSQLGLLPLCQERNYYFFESRSAGGESLEPLGELTRRWLEATFGVQDARPWIAPAGLAAEPQGVALSFGVGKNSAKRLPGPFEGELLRALAALGLPLVVDKGAGGQEGRRVERTLAKAGIPSGQACTFQGSFAAFALRIAASRLYVGYDSAGQHAAAALCVPLVTLFAGFPSERFFARWQPTGPGPKIIIRVDRAPRHADLLERTIAAARRMLEAAACRQPQTSSIVTTLTNSPIT